MSALLLCKSLRLKNIYFTNLLRNSLAATTYNVNNKYFTTNKIHVSF